MTQRLTLEIKVGAFIVAGFTLLMVFIFFIGDLSTALQPGQRLRVIFPSANGLTEGAPVQYAGVEVGKVRRLDFVFLPGQASPKVEVDVWLPASITVREDDEAAISTFGLLGEKYLEIAPGSGAGRVLGPDDRLLGKPPVSTDQIIERSDEVLNELKQTLEGINDLVGDSETHILLQEAIKEARDATRHWKILGERLNVAMLHAESGEGNLGKLLFDDELYRRMEAFVEDIRAHPWKLLSRPRKSKK